MHTCNVIWIKKVIFKNLGYIIYNMMYMYITAKKMKAMIWERESELCSWEGLKGGKERENGITTFQFQKIKILKE